MRTTVVDELRARHLITPAARLRADEAATSLRLEYESILSLREFHQTLDLPGLRTWFRQFVEALGQFSAVLTVLVANWLFGSWSAFEARCLWTKVFYNEADSA